MDAKSGDQRLHVKLPYGESGIAIPLPVAEKERLLKAVVMLRGKGEVELELRTPEGTATYHHPLKLSANWAWVELFTRVDQQGEALQLVLRYPKAQKGDELEVQRVSLFTQALPQQPEREVPPKALEIATLLGEEEPVLVEGRREIAAIPAPATRLPVSFYLLHRDAASGSVARIISRDRVSQQQLASAPLEGGDDWKWSKIGAAPGNLAGSAVSLLVAGTSEIGRLVIATRDDLEAEALDAALDVLPSGPFLLAPKATLPPDAVHWIDAPVWDSAPQASGFRKVGSDLPAEGETAARMLHDGKRLHFRFYAQEPVLRHVEQRLHEFRDAVRQRDGAVEQDDHLYLALRRPGEPSTELRLRLNAAGTLWDNASPSLKGSLNAVARRQEGAWCGVVSLPLAAFGWQPGERLEFHLARRAVAREEDSLWNGQARKLEEPQRWATLLPGAPGEGGFAGVDLPETLQVGENLLRYHGGAALLYAQLAGGDRAPENRVIPLPAATEPQAINLELPQSFARENLFLQAGVLAGDLTPLYFPPARRMEVTMPIATLRFPEGSGSYRLWQGGRKVAEGSGAGAVEIGLRRGANDLHLQIEGDALPTVEGSGFTQLSWTGKEDEANRFQTTLLWQETRLWPELQPALYAAKGTPQHLSVMLEGAHSGRHDWRLHLLLPEGVELAAASGLGARRNGKIPLYRVEEGPIEQGKRLVTIHADRPIPDPKELRLNALQSSLWLFFRAQKEGTVELWSEAQGMSEARQSFEIRLLPELAGRQAKKVIWQLWGPLELLDEEKARHALLESCLAAGVTDFDIKNAANATGWLAKTGGVRSVLNVHFLNGSLFFGPYLSTHPDQRLAKMSGSRDPSRVCTSALLEEAWPEAHRLLGEQLTRFRPASIVYDYEFSPMGDGIMHTCYCPRCLVAFRKYSQLPESTTQDGIAINRDHPEAWVDFMAWQSAAIFAKMKESLRQLDPSVGFEVYSGYQTPENPRRYGVDWRYVGEKQAAGLASMGYGRPLEAIRATREALQGIPTLFGEIIYPYVASEAMPHRPTSIARLLRRVIDARAGVLIYEVSGMDGRSWQALAEVTRLVAEEEVLILEGERKEHEGLPEADAVWLISQQRRLLCLINDSAQEKSYPLQLPPHLKSGREFYTGAAIANGAALKVPAGEARVLIFD